MSLSDELTRSASQLAVFPATPAAPERTLIDIFESTVAGHPDAPALDDGRTAQDYRALGAAVHSLAARLHRAGIGAGDRVGVRVPRYARGVRRLPQRAAVAHLVLSEAVRCLG